MLKKFFSTMFVAFLLLTATNISFATPQEISAEGEYRLGDRDSRETAKMAALADAKRKIIEQVGVYVESYSEVNKFKLTQDQIRTAANAMIKLKSEEINFYENGTVCKAFVVAIVDIDGESIKKFIDTVVDNPSQKDSGQETLTKKVKPQNNSVEKEKFLKLGGFQEYNGHYYKVFDEGIDWKPSKKRCEEMGGHLMTITSKNEQAVVQNLLFLHGNKNYYWIGGFREMEDLDGWKWITGEDFLYSNWGKGEPSNTGGHETLVAVYQYPGVYGIWLDLSEWKYHDRDNAPFFHLERAGFICEWESYEDIKI